MKNELCDWWLAISLDFVGMHRRGLFWQGVYDLFHTRKHIAPYDMDIIEHRNMRSLSYRWYAIQTTVTKFCATVARLEAR